MYPQKHYLSGVAGLSEVSTGLKVVNAIDKGDGMGIVGALLSDPGLGKLAATTMIADGISFSDVGNTLKVIDNIDKGNWTGALSTAANLSGSSDAQTAAAGLTLFNAAKTGDFTQIAGAVQGLNNTLNATNNVVTQLKDAGLVDNSVSNTLSDITGTSSLASKNVTSSITDDTGGIDTLNLGGGSNILVDVGNYTDEFGNYDAAVAAQAAAGTKSASFNQTFDAYRTAFGPNQTFTWTNPATGVTGTYTTGTKAEADAAAAAKIDALNTANLSTVTDASKTVGAQSDTAARAAAATALAKQQADALKKTESSGFFSNLASSIQDQMKLSSAAANDYLKNNPNSPITNSVSTAYEAVGELTKNVGGGTALLLNNKPLSDALVV